MKTIIILLLCGITTANAQTIPDANAQTMPDSTQAKGVMYKVSTNKKGRFYITLKDSSRVYLFRRQKH